MWPHLRRTPVVCVCSRASVHAAHPTRPWHISREHVGSVRAETNALKFKKTPSLNIHSVVSLFLLFLFFITWTDWKAGCIRHAETKENQRYNMIQVNSTVSKQKTDKPNVFLLCFFFKLFVCFSYETSHETSRTAGWTQLASSPKVRYHLQSLACC